MGADLHDDVEREERVARALRRPVRDPLVFPFSGVEARLEHRASGPFVAFAMIGLLVVALAVGSALARQRADVLAPSAMPTATPSSSPAGWQAQLMADARAAAPSTFWPLMPTYVADAVDAQVTTSASCGASSSPCLEYGFFRGASSDAEFRVLQGPAGCCLDAARPNATRDVEIRSGVSAQYDRVSAAAGRTAGRRASSGTFRRRDRPWRTLLRRARLSLLSVSRRPPREAMCSSRRSSRYATAAQSASSTERAAMASIGLAGHPTGSTLRCGRSISSAARATWPAVHS